MATALRDQIAAYEERQQEFEAEHPQKWVVFYDEQLQGFFESFEDAADYAVQHFGRGPYLIRQVGVPVFRMPPALLYGAIRHQ